MKRNVDFTVHPKRAEEMARFIRDNLDYLRKMRGKDYFVIEITEDPSCHARE
jgi:hypothetical protein